MKNLGLLLSALLMGFIGSQLTVPALAQKDRPKEKVGEFTKIVVRSADSENDVSITPDGLWVSRGMKVSASVQMQGKAPVITVMDHRKEIAGHQLALTLDNEGVPYIQVAKPGKEVGHISYATLKGLTGR